MKKAIYAPAPAATPKYSLLIAVSRNSYGGSAETWSGGECGRRRLNVRAARCAALCPDSGIIRLRECARSLREWRLPWLQLRGAQQPCARLSCGQLLYALLPYGQLPWSWQSSSLREL